MAEVLILVALVFGVNVLPAFAPPTWLLLVYFRFTYSLPIPLLVGCGAAAAAAGRCVLAIAFRHLGSRLPRARRESIQALGTAVSESRMGIAASLVFFAVSPVPSNALFEAVGLARVRLAPPVAAFLVGRLCSYTIYVVAAATVGGTVRDALGGGFTSPRALALGVVGVAMVVALVLVDWVRVIDAVRRRTSRRQRRI